GRDWPAVAGKDYCWLLILCIVQFFLGSLRAVVAADPVFVVQVANAWVGSMQSAATSGQHGEAWQQDRCGH
ncbi:MAG: hypothetical protein AWT59_3430, partial [Candidatus Gallionella acididurans]